MIDPTIQKPNSELTLNYAKRQRHVTAKWWRVGYISWLLCILQFPWLRCAYAIAWGALWGDNQPRRESLILFSLVAALPGLLAVPSGILAACRRTWVDRILGALGSLGGLAWSTFIIRQFIISYL
jgi:ABC-type dipeptide/oligopeptide/nickel transport system permease component